MPSKKSTSAPRKRTSTVKRTPRAPGKSPRAAKSSPGRLPSTWAELANALGITDRQLRTLRAEHANAPQDIDLAAWSGWHALWKAGHFEPSDLKDERTRHERAKRERAELLLAKERGEADTRANYERAISEALGPVETFLNDLPYRASLDANPEAPHVAETALQAHIDKFRKEISKRVAKIDADLTTPDAA